MSDTPSSSRDRQPDEQDDLSTSLVAVGTLIGNASSFKHSTLRRDTVHRNRVWAKLLLEHRAQRALSPSPPARPPIVALFGPTNAGKSTIVNLLLGKSCASMSATARHTQHPALFVRDAEHLVAGPLSHLATSRTVTTETVAAQTDDELARGSYQPHLQIVDMESSHASLSNIAILDTPDFSTEAADAYMHEVLTSCAQADVLVCVVTPESYADAFGLELLRLFAQSGTRMIVVANKASTDPASLADIQSLLNTEIHIDERSLVTLPVVAGTDSGSRVGSLLATPASASLIDTISHAVEHTVEPASRDEHLRATANWIHTHLPEILSPLQTRIDSAAHWHTHTHATANQAARFFTDTYLAAERYPEFDLAVVRVLRLLEVPVLGPALRFSSAAVRMPVKALGLAFGFSRARTRSIAEEERDAIIRCANRAIDALRARTRAESDANPLPPAFASLVADMDESWIPSQIDGALTAHQSDVAAHIETRAQAIYEALRAKPAVLAALRASNILTGLGSAAAVVISHGLNWHDALLAPVAMGVQQELLRQGLGVVVDQQRTKLKHEHELLVSDLIERTVVSSLTHTISEPASQAAIDCAFHTIEQLKRGGSR